MAPTEILPGLFLGDAADAIEWALTMGPDKKRALICVLEVCPQMLPWGYHVQLVGTASNGLVSPTALNLVAAMIHSLREDSYTVLVHCGAGIERSPLAVAWFMSDYGEEGVITMDDAYKFIMSKRPQVQDRQSWIAPE